MTSLLFEAPVAERLPEPSPTHLVRVVQDPTGIRLEPVYPETGFVGITEIAEMLSLSRQRVNQLTQHRSFPTPVVRTKAGSFWLKTEIEEWSDRRQWRVEKYSSPHVPTNGNAPQAAVNGNETHTSPSPDVVATPPASSVKATATSLSTDDAPTDSESAELEEAAS
jgi:predicted DNA-binding transcriptional regulator AlpA